VDELIRIRELQKAQAEALAEGDVEALEHLAVERREANERLLAVGGPSGAAPASARDLAAELLEADRELLAAAYRRRGELSDELAGLSRGRGALGGYRPGRAPSRLVDRSG